MLVRVWMRVRIRISTSTWPSYRSLSWLHEQVITLRVDEPVYQELFALGATSTTSSKQMRRRRVYGESKKVGRLRKVGDETSVEEEVDQDEDVQEED
jgi:hypothetical protein